MIFNLCVHHAANVCPWSQLAAPPELLIPCAHALSNIPHSCHAGVHIISWVSQWLYTMNADPWSCWPWRKCCSLTHHVMKTLNFQTGTKFLNFIVLQTTVSNHFHHSVHTAFSPFTLFSFQHFCQCHHKCSSQWQTQHHSVWVSSCYHYCALILKQFKQLKQLEFGK